MGAKERKEIREAINAAKNITSDTSNDFAYEVGQQKIREAEKKVGPIERWTARQSTY